MLAPEELEMLSGLRIIDFTDEWGLMAGSVLGELGADVIQVEPRTGSRARRLGPFALDNQSPEDSLFWWAYGRNKRSVALDLGQEEDLTFFRRLIRTADVLMESSVPGELARLVGGLARLSDENPGLVVTSVSPFGQTGPKAMWPASDLTVMAASGYQYVSGDADRPPLRISVPQAYLHAGLEAAVATLVALVERQRSGRGQHIDISAQESAAICTNFNMLAKHWGEEPMVRMAGGYMNGPVFNRQTFPAKDGHVNMTFTFGSTLGVPSRRLIEWIYEEGGCGSDIRDKDYVGLGAALFDGSEPLEELDRIHRTIAAFTSTKTKAELLRAARERDLLMVPIWTIGEVREDSHLAARNFWQPLEVAGTTYHFPGPFARFSDWSPSVASRRAPKVDEHREEIECEKRREHPSTAHPARPHSEPPLAGLKVVDFGWAYVEPSCMRMLADYGATVIKVESLTRLDPLRTRSVRAGGTNPEASASFHNFNAGKLGLTLNLRLPGAQEVVRKLAAWADVFGEAFTPSAMKGWNLHYEALKTVNPRLVYVSTCLGGQSGPYADLAGYGNLSAALAGFNYLCAWPDRDPAGPNGFYTDYTAPRFLMTAVLAALAHRDRTGVGQHIDVSQLEASLHFLSTAFLDYEVNGRVAGPSGNRSLMMSPHGVFPCIGSDRWIALAVDSDEQFRRLWSLMGLSEPAADRDFATLAARKQNEDRLESLVTSWTSSRHAEEVETELIAAGIPAHIVSDARDLGQDVQLRHRGHWVSVPHDSLGEVVVEGSRFHLDRTPGGPRKAGPLLGGDTYDILSEILGYSDDEIARLMENGTLE